MDDLLTYIKCGRDLKGIVDERNRYPNNKSSFFNLNKGVVNKALASMQLLNAGYTSSIDGIQYDAVIYMGNENISFYIMKTTQVISFAFTGCYFAVCRCDSEYVAFHIPPRMSPYFNDLSKKLNLYINIIYNPMKLITGGPQINSCNDTPKIWGIVDIQSRIISAIEINEDLRSKTVDSFKVGGNRCKTRANFGY